MRCNCVNQPSTVSKFIATNLSYTFEQFCQAIAQKTHLATLLVLLGIGGGVWITHEVIAPQIVQAETDRINITLDREVDETYQTLLRRADATARQAAQRSFDQNNMVTDVAITILAENQGAIAPVLSMQVSRKQWYSRPNSQRWINYYTSTEILLGFRNVAVAVTPVAPPPGPGQGNFRNSR